MLSHRKSSTKEYFAWQAMKSRCHNAKAANYARYGGRGIKVCNRWLNSFENFYADMGDKPSDKYSLDRINSSKGYNPSNCRWATSKEQSSHLKNNRFIKFKGKKITYSEAARVIGVDWHTIDYRVKQGRKIDVSFFKKKYKTNSVAELVR